MGLWTITGFCWIWFNSLFSRLLSSLFSHFMQLINLNWLMLNITQRRLHFSSCHFLKTLTATWLRTNLSCFFCEGLWYWGVFALMCQQDGFQEHYAQTGRFPSPVVSPPRRPWSLINWLFWACLLLYPLGLLFSELISSGSVLTILVSVALCSAGWFHAFMPRRVHQSFPQFNQLLFVQTFHKAADLTAEM